jgi:hypothetical protein
MNCQHLVVDFIRNWHKHPDNEGFMTKELESFNVTLVTFPEEYPGTAAFKAIILWDYGQDKPNADTVATDRQKEVFDMVKRFAVGVNAKIIEVKHDRLTTYVKLKPTNPKNVEAWEWLDLKPEDYKDVE